MVGHAHAQLEWEDPITIESDTALTGWGAACQGQRTGGPWTQVEAQMHMEQVKCLSTTCCSYTGHGDFLGFQKYTRAQRRLRVNLAFEDTVRLSGEIQSTALDVAAYSQAGIYAVGYLVKMSLHGDEVKIMDCTGLPHHSRYGG